MFRSDDTGFFAAGVDFPHYTLCDGTPNHQLHDADISVVFTLCLAVPSLADKRNALNFHLYLERGYTFTAEDYIR